MSYENTNESLYERLVKLSIQQLREKNGNAQDALRLERMLEDQRKAAREENQKIDISKHEKCVECPYLFLIGERPYDVRGKKYCPSCIEEARENDELLVQENDATLYELMETYLIQNHQLFVEAVKNEDEDEEFKYEKVVQSFLGGSAFVEFAVENSELDEEMIEEIIENRIDADGFNGLVELYHELCNTPVLK